MEERTKHKDEAYRVAIVGLGPKGLYGLERLLAQMEDMKLDCPVHIHVYNQNEFFGAGDIYRNDQPSHLIMNYSNRNIDMWTKELPNCILEDTPDFTTWLSSKTGIPAAHNKNGFSSRATVGNYLMDGFIRLCQNLSQNIEVFPHISVVTDIENRQDGYVIRTKEKGDGDQKHFKKILMTTGHSWNGARFNTAHGTEPYIEFIYPTNKNLGSIPKDVTVAFKGMGLTFIDAVLALTEGYGGTFRKKSDGSYHYVPSGNEPKKLIPFSRTGIPMIPRNGEADDGIPPYYLTEEVVKNLKILSPICFENHILPLIKKEFCFNYYKVLFKSNNKELLYNADFTVIEKQIDDYHETYPKEKRFNWEMLEWPFKADDLVSHKEIIEYVAMCIQQVEKGPLMSPILAAAGTWRKISAVFNEVYSFGGLDAASHQLFDSYYFGFFNRIAYGPPLENMKKIHALAKCGILDFDFARNPEVTLVKETNSFLITSSEVQKSAHVDYLVDARIPKGSTSGKIGTLFSNLLKRGILRFFCNEDDVKYTPGCIDIDHKGRPLDCNGTVNKDITFYGTPTEGITFDNDTLSRKRNNFASQWAFDVAMDIKHNHENIIKDQREHGILQR
ncbi:FAD/NAD(P)-binding protein [Sediminicola luteus]|uniref:FAD/NAD(P)-binding protein n=1 Tax=Sediminicola luteus TaxID=319238 RepID=A0ABV2TUU3_9FLAO